MKKTRKYMIIGALMLAVATSLVAGSLAIYTKTLAADGNMNTKSFDIRETTENSIDIKLAPGETDTWDFVLTNIDENNNVTEVDMGQVTTVNIPVAFTEKADVVVKLYATNAEGVRTEIVGTQNGNSFIFTQDDFSKAGVSTTTSYQMEFEWADAAEDKTDIDLESTTGPVNVTIVGTQR